jgi:hypothetical protein
MTATLVPKISPLTTGQLQFEQVKPDPTTHWYRDKETDHTRFVSIVQKSEYDVHEFGLVLLAK